MCLLNIKAYNNVNIKKKNLLISYILLVTSYKPLVNKIKIWVMGRFFSFFQFENLLYKALVISFLSFIVILYCYKLHWSESNFIVSLGKFLKCFLGFLFCFFYFTYKIEIFRHIYAKCVNIEPHLVFFKKIYFLINPSQRQLIKNQRVCCF